MSRKLNSTLSHKLAEAYASRASKRRVHRVGINVERYMGTLERATLRNEEYEAEIQAFIDRTVGATSQIFAGAHVNQ